MSRLKGIDVKLVIRSESGTDPFGAPIKEESLEIVKDVLVGQPSSDDIQDSLSLYGKKVQYILGIPKGDTHKWEDTEVCFFGQKFRTFGYVTQGIEGLVPLKWNKKIGVERIG